ncbi:MAG: TldD/PmbA family protein [Clostridia bacterium]|nr:TldD/PmbA family protein [Clostridia bacterium]
MRFDYFFRRAKECGIEDAELYVTSTTSLSMSLFHGEIDQLSQNTSLSVIARGMVGGKCGSASCDVWDRSKADYLIREILANAAVIENDDPQFLFEGSPRYRRVNTFNAQLSSVSLDEKKNVLLSLEDKIRHYDERITEVEGVSYSERTYSTVIRNSKGLKLSQKGNYFYFYGGAVAKSGEQVKTGGELFLDNDFSKFDLDAFAKVVAENAIAQLGGEACESSTYPAVLSQEVVSSLLSSYIHSADAEEVQKRSSLFINRLNKAVASSKVTVEDRPLDKTVFARAFDDEGVATYNKPIIRNGRLKTYLYNLTTAAKSGTKSTGNASRRGGKIGVAPAFLSMKPGTMTQEDLFRLMGNGVFITEIHGMHAGLNPQSGNFSLQSTGFLVKDGRRDRPLDIITVSGNLMELFKDVTEVGSDLRTFPSSVSCPSVLVRKLKVAGK